MQWLHKQGRAHNDIKFANIRVRLNEDRSAFEHATLVDVGSSAKFTGDTSASILHCCDAGRQSVV